MRVAQTTRTDVRIPSFAPKQQAIREDLQRRYQAVVSADERKRKQRNELQRRYQAVVGADERKQQEEMIHRVLLAFSAELGPKWKWTNVREFRKLFGDERTDPRLWSQMPKIVQRHFATLKRNAGERLSEAERSVLNS